MLLALLSDVHGNLDALEACLRHAREHGAERYAFLGDYVGYGAEPGAVTDVIAHHAASGAIVVRGNHDAAPDEWTRTMLSPAQKEFLASLPMCVRNGETCFVHSSAATPEAWEYVETSAAARESIDAATTTYTFSGHLHDQVLYFRTLAGKTAPFRPVSGSVVPVPSHRGWLALVGSVGQPRDGNPAAAYAVFDEDAEEMTFYRVAYDHAAAAAKIRRAGQPEWLAQRLERGV
jgi:predicted phosphodiesterase